jgi:hypothetical protein
VGNDEAAHPVRILRSRMRRARNVRRHPTRPNGGLGPAAWALSLPARLLPLPAPAWESGLLPGTRSKPRCARAEENQPRADHRHAGRLGPFVAHGAADALVVMSARHHRSYSPTGRVTMVVKMQDKLVRRLLWRRALLAASGRRANSHRRRKTRGLHHSHLSVVGINRRR